MSIADRAAAPPQHRAADRLDVRAVLILIACCACWGVNQVAIKIANEGIRQAPTIRKPLLIEMGELDEVDRQFLVERHLVSREHIVHPEAKGVAIGEGFDLAGKRGSDAHDEILRDDRGLYRKTNHAGGIEGGVSNGEEIIVRAAMKPLPTLMRPLASVDLETGEAAEALVERSDTAAVEALAVVAEACVAWELARAAREKFGGDALADFLAAHRAYLERINWQARTR